MLRQEHKAGGKLFVDRAGDTMVPDDAKAGVTKACRHDPDLNSTYQEMFVHYGVGSASPR